MKNPRPDILADMDACGGSPLDLAEQQKKELRETFANRDVGLWFWCQEVFGFRDLRWDLHGPICQFLGHWGESTLDDGTVMLGHPGMEEERVVDSNRRLMLRIPRECFKTSVGTRGAPTWLLFTQDINYTFGIFNEKQDNVISWLGAVCNVVESSLLLQVLYPEYIPKGISIADREKGLSKPRNLKWGGGGILFERDSRGVSELSIEPQGIGGAHAGKHYTHMVWDDIIGLEASKSAAVMQAAIEWVDNSRPLERPAEGGAVLINHTRWAWGDVYSHIEKRWPGEYKLLHRSLLEHPVTHKPDVVAGESIFPEKISTRKAREMHEKDAFHFSSQYMNIPKAGKNMSFNPDTFGAFHLHWLNEREPAFKLDRTGLRDAFDPTAINLECGEETGPNIVPYSMCSRAIILDPAPTKKIERLREPNAANGINVVAMDPWGRLYALEGMKVKAPPVSDTPGEEGILDILIRLARAWAAPTIGIESVNFSAVYGPLFQRIVQLDPQYADVAGKLHFTETFTEGREKTARIVEDLGPDFNSRLWYFNYSDHENERHLGPTAYLRQDLSEFPFGDLDLPDSLAYTKQVLSRPQSTEEKRRYARRTKQLNQDRGITGYGDFV
jgi:hypothetical protein